jgi:hypothetical protein
MSEKLLAYSDENYRHRYLVIYEAAGMNGDMMSYLIRSLLSEGRIRYETVEKTKEGYKPRLIVKEGPTGLITTTTAARLHPENETRLLSLGVIDTQEQTKAVMRAIAAESSNANTIDYDRWHALQKWLASGERRVTMPFAAALAELIPPVAVRLRRDFKLLLTLIQAHALLHRERRDRDEQGCIVATLDDYAAVRDLIEKLFSEGIEATVPTTVRETVNAVAAIIATGKNEASQTDIANHLKLDKNSVHHRVHKAIERGFLVNNETKRGMPARIAINDPMPEEIEILPQRAKLEDRWSVGVSPEGIITETEHTTESPSPPIYPPDASSNTPTPGSVCAYCRQPADHEPLCWVDDGSRRGWLHRRCEEPWSS